MAVANSPSSCSPRARHDLGAGLGSAALGSAVALLRRPCWRNSSTDVDSANAALYTSPSTATYLVPMITGNGTPRNWSAVAPVAGPPACSTDGATIA